MSTNETPAAELDVIAARLAGLKTLEPTAALGPEVDAIEARLAAIKLATA